MGYATKLCATVLPIIWTPLLAFWGAMIYALGWQEGGAPFFVVPLFGIWLSYRVVKHARAAAKKRRDEGPANVNSAPNTSRKRRAARL